MEDDAEWVGVDHEFGRPDGPSTTLRPRPSQPRPDRRFPPMDPATEPPHDANDVAGFTPTAEFNATALAGAVGGILGVVLLLLIIYMFVLRRKLTKAKVARGDSEYRLRVEDVAHLTHLDETSNTYVNTTDLQKLVSSVRAKKKGEEKLPLPPRMNQQAPPLVRKPTSHPAQHHPAGSSGQVDNDGFRGDVDVVTLRPPMPLPHSNPDVLQGVLSQGMCVQSSETVSETIYSNLDPPVPPPSSSPTKKNARIEPPKIMPPPPPGKKHRDLPPKEEESHVTVSPMIISTNDTNDVSAPLSPTIIARPAPPPPVAKSPSQKNPTQPAMQANTQKPTPPVAPKPQKGPPSKPAVPKASKPGVLGKGRALPPLKMALLHSDSRSSIESFGTPDTGVMDLTPDLEEEKGVGSISAKIAFLEGKMKTPVMPPRAIPNKS